MSVVGWFRGGGLVVHLLVGSRRNGFSDTVSPPKLGVVGTAVAHIGVPLELLSGRQA
jgi:hypothetical protein